MIDEQADPFLRTMESCVPLFRTCTNPWEDVHAADGAAINEISLSAYVTEVLERRKAKRLP